MFDNKEEIRDFCEKCSFFQIDEFIEVGEGVCEEAYCACLANKDKEPEEDEDGYITGCKYFEEGECGRAEYYV